MRLIRASDPDAVARDEALRLLAERAVLTRSVCRELLEAPTGYVSRRTRAALWSLLRWIADHFGDSVRTEPGADDGIDQMITPPDTEAVVAEIRAGAAVCDAFFMLLTADSSAQADGDRARISSALSDYWGTYPAAADLPAL